MRVGQVRGIERGKRHIDGLRIALDLSLVRLAHVDEQDPALGNALGDLFRVEVVHVVATERHGIPPCKHELLLRRHYSLNGSFAMFARAPRLEKILPGGGPIPPPAVRSPPPGPSGSGKSPSHHLRWARGG